MKTFNFIFIIRFMVIFSLGNIVAQDNPNEAVVTSEEISSFFRKTKGVRDQVKLSDLELRLAISFTLDSDVLTSEARHQLDQLAKTLNDPEFKGIKIELAGHTCDLGNAEYNLKLSKKRVQSAVNYLTNTHHIASSRLSTEAYGERMPLIPGADTEEERAVNRRVVVYLPENRGAIEQMLRELPVKMGFCWGIFSYTGDGRERLVPYDNSGSLHSNDEYRIFIRPASRKYIYVYQIDSRGKGEWLFPREERSYTNPLRPGEYYLPSKSEVFVLDDNVGQESIYLFVTDDPVEEIEDLIRQKNEKPVKEVITQVVKTRGLKKIRIGPPAKTTAASSHSIVLSKIDDTGEINLNQSADQLATILAQYKEFYTEIRFEHK